MVVVGADVHKRTHTFVAVDEAGMKRGERTVRATRAGHRAAMEWVLATFGAVVTWAIEDCRNMSALLERDLLGADQKVVRVPPTLAAEHRKVARTRGKSDPIDALAVARAALREPNLPVACHDTVSRELRLLTDRREALVANRTAAINSLRWRVHELDPEYDIKPGALTAKKHQAALSQWLEGREGIIAELAREELADIISWTTRINALATRIGKAVCVAAPSLLAMPGCGALSAAKIVGETAGVTRFRGEAQFACHAGVAPIPVWSGASAGRVRLSRAGNRQLNAALHRIALTQIGMPGSAGRLYYEKKLAEKKTPREARRCLKRKLARVVFNHLVTDHHNRTADQDQAAA